MFSRIRKRVTYANVALTLALVFAMTGGAFAAGKYLITSTKQISPKVLASLKGKAGPAGAAGATGAVGATGPAGAAGPAGPAGTGVQGLQGPEGKEGKEGPAGKNGTNGKNGTTGFTKTLPSGETETGTWTLQATAAGAGEPFYAPISFPIPLATPATSGQAAHVEFIKELSAKTSNCAGSAGNPTAKAGYLCVYAEVADNAETAGFLNLENNAEETYASRFGTVVYRVSEGAGPVITIGSWAVTAE